MARSISSQKRMRQNVKRAIRNRERKTLLKTLTRRFSDALSAKDVAKAETAFKDVVKSMDRYSIIGTIHRNTAARRKSLFARRLNALKAAAH